MTNRTLISGTIEQCEVKGILSSALLTAHEANALTNVQRTNALGGMELVPAH